jgi:hypothetical protein
MQLSVENVSTLLTKTAGHADEGVPGGRRRRTACWVLRNRIRESHATRCIGLYPEANEKVVPRDIARVSVSSGDGRLRRRGSQVPWRARLPSSEEQRARDQQKGDNQPAQNGSYASIP